MTWGIIHADGHEDVSDLVTTRQSARDWAEELDEDCDCGGQHRVFGRNVVIGTATSQERRD
jgi:hypothetical protein